MQLWCVLCQESFTSFEMKEIMVEQVGVVVSSVIVAVAVLTLGFYYLYPTDKEKKTRKQGRSSSNDVQSVSVGREGASSSDIFKTSNELRGYKKTSDGKITTYFHREISNETKEIIGDISPKRIDTKDVDVNSSQKSTASNSGSLWNAAGTWEEKDVSNWATKRLKQLFENVEVFLSLDIGSGMVRHIDVI